MTLLARNICACLSRTSLFRDVINSKYCFRSPEINRPIIGRLRDTLAYGGHYIIWKAKSPENSDLGDQIIRLSYLIGFRGFLF